LLTSPKTLPHDGRSSTTPYSPTAPLSLRANYSWALVGNLVYLTSQWAILSAIAKIGEPEMVGQFALALAITAPIVMFCNLNLAVVQATDAGREYVFADYFSLRVLTSIAAFVVIVAIIAVAGYRTETSLVIFVVGVAKIIEAVSDVIYGLFQQRQRMDSLARSLLIRGPSSVIAIIIGLYLTHSVLWGAVLLAATWAVLLVANDARTARRILLSTRALRINWAPTRWRSLVLLSWPMGVVSLVNALVPNIPRYFIEHELGEAALGFYAALAYLIVAGQTGVNALANAVNSKLAIHYAEGNRPEFQLLTAKTMRIAAAAGLLAVLVSAAAGPQLLAFLYTPSYAAHAPVLVYLMMAGCVSYIGTFLWNGVTAARRFRAQVPIFAASIAVALFLNAILVPRFGLLGAAMASLVTAMIQVVAMAALYRAALRGCAAAQHFNGDHAAGEAC
jgi:O-antigen/teichoic acid export membrane protein